ncbi:MAG: UbiA family prenyltransferase [Pirellulaceae bacterium]
MSDPTPNQAQSHAEAMTDSGTAIPGAFKSWCQLFRVSNIFTAFADILMGYSVAAGVFVAADTVPVLCMLLASGMLYSAGMVLNDVFDFDVDKIDRPGRPIPSGTVSLGKARAVGFGLLLAGIGLTAVPSILAEAQFSSRSLVVGAITAMCIIAYDAVLKKTPLAPFAMGSCRVFNVLLGMTLAPTALESVLGGFSQGQLWVAIGMGTYVTGVTWFARTESRNSHRGILTFGAALMMLGIMLLPYGVYVSTELPHSVMAKNTTVIWMLFGSIAGTILFRCVNAITDPSPRNVQIAIIHCLRSLIVINASVILTVGIPVLGVVCVLMMIPMLIVGKWIRST